ncbi:MAG: translation initiation factor IF-2, partial [Bacteroidetes bacterium]|nr:translation initiation factor IF-2 [Bacteroidota bacterium]
MAKRLVKIAKELNVGVATIVEHLNDNGFEIDNKPTAKVSDEMYDELLRAFESSISVKEQADKITLGYNKEKEEEAAKTPEAKADQEVSKEKETSEEAQPQEAEASPESAAETEAEPITEEKES